MTFPDLLGAEPAAAEVISLEGWPTLPRSRQEADFPDDQRFVYLFDPKWRQDGPELVTGYIEEVNPDDRPFHLRLGLGLMYPMLSEEARLLTGQRPASVGMGEPSPLPDLTRQLMLHTPELRPQTPSEGYVTLRTPHASVPRIIGIGMNDNALIPESFMAELQQDASVRDVWLLDGPEDPEHRAALEQAILDWAPQPAPDESGEAAAETGAEEPQPQRRARPHVDRTLSIGHKVLEHRIPGST